MKEYTLVGGKAKLRCQHCRTAFDEAPDRPWAFCSDECALAGAPDGEWWLRMMSQAVGNVRATGNASGNTADERE